MCRPAAVREFMISLLSITSGPRPDVLAVRPPAALARRGYTVASIDYRLVPAVTVEQQAEMARHAAIERYAAGELILGTGVVPEAMLFIMSGAVLLTADAPDGSRTEAGTLEEGAYLGQSTLVRHPTSGSYIAIDEVTLVRVERDAIERLVQRNPLLLQEFGRSIEERRTTFMRLIDDDIEETGSVSQP